MLRKKPIDYMQAHNLKANFSCFIHAIGFTVLCSRCTKHATVFHCDMNNFDLQTTNFKDLYSCELHAS